MEQKKPGILEQIFYESEHLKTSRRKVSEALRRVCSWFNKEFKASESLPTEFKDFESQREIDRNLIWPQFSGHEIMRRQVV